MKIVYIHGATASHNSFAFIQEVLKAEDYLYIDYPRTKTAYENLEDMTRKIGSTTGPIFIVCHSMGGLYALHLLERFPKRIREVVSLATPFAGSELAILGKVMNKDYLLFNDIMPHSDFVKSTKYFEVKCPWTQIVTTIGDVPWMETPNDGVVTRKSMTARTDINYVEIDDNHYEIVQSGRVVKLLKELVQKY